MVQGIKIGILYRGPYNAGLAMIHDYRVAGRTGRPGGRQRDTHTTRSTHPIPAGRRWRDEARNRTSQQLDCRRSENQAAQGRRTASGRPLRYAVIQTPYRNDQGRDAILSKDGHKFLLKCKKYGENNVSGRPDLQRFHSAIVTEKAISGFKIVCRWRPYKTD
jgi:hypothetical protein